MFLGSKGCVKYEHDVLVLGFDRNPRFLEVGLSKTPGLV